MACLATGLWGAETSFRMMTLRLLDFKELALHSHPLDLIEETYLR